MNGDASTRPGPAGESVNSSIPGFVAFAGSLDESLIDAMLAMKISDRLRTLSRYADAVAGFRPA